MLLRDWARANIFPKFYDLKTCWYENDDDSLNQQALIRKLATNLAWPTNFSERLLSEEFPPASVYAKSFNEPSSMSFNFRKQLKALLLMNSFIFLSAEFSIADSLFVGKSIKQHSKAASACAWATQNVHRSMSHLSAEKKFLAFRDVRTHIKRIDGKSSESFLCQWMVAVSSEWSSHVNFNRDRWIKKLFKCWGFCAECGS